MKKKILILGSYGQENIGDEALLEVIVERLRKDYDIVVNSANPPQTEERYKIKSFPTRLKKGLKTKIKALFSSKAYLFGGGTILVEHEEDSSSKTWLSRRPLWLILVILILGKILRRKTILLAIGIGPLKTRLARVLTFFCLNLAGLVTVRDKLSLNLAHQLGVKRRIYFTADLSLLLDPAKRHFSLWEKEKLVIGISPSYYVRGRQKLAPQTVEALAGVSNWLINNFQAKIVFLPMRSGFGPKDDLWMSQEIMKKVENKTRVAIFSRRLLPKEMLATFSSFDLLIGMRLHALVFAFLNKVPMVAIDHDPKISGFMESINKKQLTCELERLSFKNLAKIIKSALVKNQEIKNDFAQEIPRQKKKTEKAFIILRQFLEK